MAILLKACVTVADGYLSVLLAHAIISMVRNKFLAPVSLFQRLALNVRELEYNKYLPRDVIHWTRRLYSLPQPGILTVSSSVRYSFRLWICRTRSASFHEILTQMSYGLSKTWEIHLTCHYGTSRRFRCSVYTIACSIVPGALSVPLP
jgi:hypothetical protein